MFLIIFPIINHNRKRIFITRSVGKRGIVNEDEVNAILKKYHFINISFDNLPMEEQMNIIYNAEIVAGVHGAGLSNLVFSSQHTKCCIEIIPKSHVTPAFWFLSSSLGLSYFVVPPKEGWHKIIDIKTANLDVNVDIVKLEEAILMAIDR